MKRFGRKFWISTSIVLLIPILFITAVIVFFPVDRISDQLGFELRSIVGGRVIVGEAGVKWWPKLGVTIKDISIDSDGAYLEFSTGSVNDLGNYGVRLEEIEIQVAVGPLLKKEIFVDAVRLNRLSLSGDFKEQRFELRNGNLALLDLQISMDSAKSAGQSPTDSTNPRPVGEVIPEDLVLSFQGHAQSLLVQGLPLNDVNFNGGLDHRILTMETIEAQIDSGEMSGNLEIDYVRDPNGSLDFEFEAEKVPAGVLLQPWASSLGEKLETSLDAGVRGNCILGKEDVIKQTLTLSGRVSSSEGTLWARDWLGDIAPYLGQRQDLADIHFRSLKHRMRIEKGNYVIDKLIIDGKETYWQGEGLLGLDGTIDMGVNVKLPPGFTPELGQWSFMADTLRDENGRVNLSLLLTGMAAKPKVGVDLSSLQNVLENNSGESLKKGLGGLLDKWKSR